MIDRATAACLEWDLGATSSCADAFRRLAGGGILERPLADRLVRAAGFRNVVAHAYDTPDMARVFRAAQERPADLHALFAALRDRLPSGSASVGG